MAILILFFFSGATALVYEVLWSKCLTLLFGSTIQAQTVVLAVFMGGLALGNKLFSRGADSNRHPLTIYGRLELAIGLYALLFTYLYRVTDSIFASVGSRLLDHSGSLLVVKGLLSMALLLGPTILMGGTFPLLAAWLQKSTPDAGRRSARFYSVNSLGAVCGAGLTGFWLVERFGVRETMNLTALANLIIGATAILIGRAQSLPPSPSPGPSVKTQKPTAPDPPPAGVGFRRACLMVALTGFVSMGLEVLASRCLCLIFGSSLQVFAIVLMAFILGIGIGSAVIASPQFKQLRGETTAIFLLVASALFIGVMVFNIQNLFAVYIAAEDGFNRTLMGYHYHQTLVAVVSIFVLGLPAATLGSVLPLSIRLASASSDLLGDRVGRLLTWNTLGAVGGSLLTGFVLMPKLGLRGSFIALASVLVVAAVLVAMVARRLPLIAVGAAVGLFLIVASLQGDEAWRYLLSAGVFRVEQSNYTMPGLLKRREMVHLEFYEDAADATVSVENIIGTDDHNLRINGKVDASTRGDLPTQLLLAYLPLMARPESKDVFCFGMGSGTTAGATLNYPIESLTIAENCEPVLRAASLFERWNNAVLLNNRTHVYHEDARTALKLSRKQFDVIISEPSNPWMIGVANVFTREFYRTAASRLKPGGIMAQWFHTYEMDDPAVNVVLRTFGSVFPNMEIWDVEHGDIVILGSDRPWPSKTEVFAQALQLDGPRNGLSSIGLGTPAAILARRFASQRTAFAIPGTGPVQGDDTPILEYAAPRAFYIHALNQGVHRLMNFDERTWQMDLASDEANNDLSKLDPPTLRTAFGGNIGSVNYDLLVYLDRHFAQYSGRGMAQPVVINNHAMLCSLQGTNKSFGVFTPPSASTNAIVATLAAAEYSLRSDTTSSNAIESVKNALDSLPGYNPQGADWSPDYYADMAIKACLRVPDPARAKAILLRGLQLEPESDQLGYLSRIMLRKKILQPGDLPQAGMK